VGPGGVSFNDITLLYLLGAGLAVYQLQRNWRAYISDKLTAQSRQVAAMVAFFLLVPVGVLLHEFGHMLAAWSTGSTVLGLHYFVYWGYVEYIPANNSPLLDWYVALAGNFVSYILGIACWLAATYATGLRINFRVTLSQLGMLELLQTLIAYPLISLAPSFYGDWDSIYSFRAPVASGITLAVHIVSLVVYVIVIRRTNGMVSLPKAKAKVTPLPE
jgi:hypothetical protein